MTQQMKDVATMTYREATAELEQVVRALESNQLELEESLELYKRGVELLASLRARLADAEQQVSALMGQIEVDTDERDTTLSVCVLRHPCLSNCRLHRDISRWRHLFQHGCDVFSTRAHACVAVRRASSRLRHRIPPAAAVSAPCVDGSVF